MNKTTIKEASLNAGDTGIICVNGANVYWDGFGVMNADDATGTAEFDGDTEIYGGDNDEYRTA